MHLEAPWLRLSAVAAQVRAGAPLQIFRITNSPPEHFGICRHSTRARNAGITAGQSCMGCHAAINLVGFAFENFDSMGRVRSVETAYSIGGKVLATHAISTDSPSVNLGGQTTSVKNGLTLVDSMMQENILPGCFVKQVSRFYRIQKENADDACLLSNMYSKSMIQPDAPILEVFRRQFLTQNIFKRRMN